MYIFLLIYMQVQEIYKDLAQIVNKQQEDIDTIAQHVEVSHKAAQSGLGEVGTTSTTSSSASSSSTSASSSSCSCCGKVYG